MTDAAMPVVPQKIKRAPRSVRGPIERWLSWSSLHLPEIWRLRIHIVLAMHTVMLVLALGAPLVFAWAAGPDPKAYCSQTYDAVTQTYVSAATGPCVDYVRYPGEVTYDEDGNYNEEGAGQYTYYSGFNYTEIQNVLLLYIFVCFAFAMTWLFYVSRGVRLRDIVPANSKPGLYPLFLLLALFAVWPTLGYHAMFEHTHGGGLPTLITGYTDIIRDDGTPAKVFAPRDSIRVGISLGHTYVLIGIGLALFLAICLKIMIFDGLVGLLRASLFAVLGGAVLVGFGVLLNSSPLQSFATGLAGGSSATGSLVYIFLCGVPSALVLLVLHKKDVWRGIRRQPTRTFAMAYALYAPIWLMFGLISILLRVFGRHIDQLSLFIGWIGIFMLIALASSFTLGGIARLSLLPRP